MVSRYRTAPALGTILAVGLAAGFSNAPLRGQAADPETLIPAGSTWLYRTGNEGLGPSWPELGFNDFLWSRGPAELGYGDGDEATVLPARPDDTSYVTTYFRHRFTLDDPGRFDRIMVRLKADDGAVLYLNGREQLRFNLPEGTPIAFETRATASLDGEAEGFNDFEVLSSDLVAGENVVAVEVHQSVGGGADLSFDLEFTGVDLDLENFVAEGAVWRFRTGETDPGEGWREVGFDDDLWLSGRAELGYGDGDEVTVVPRPPGEDDSPFITTFFRHAFLAHDPHQLGRLILRLKVDDGAVVYVNGVEIYRFNLPPGAIELDTLASEIIQNEAEEPFHLLDLGDVGGALVAGENLLAVEVHQHGYNSSDLSFDLGLTGVYEPDRRLAAVEAGGIRYGLHASPPRVEREAVGPGGGPLGAIPLEAPANALWVEGAFIYLASGGEVVRYDLDGGGRTPTALDLSYFDPAVEVDPATVVVPVNPGAAARGTLRVTNTGRTPLNWEATTFTPGDEPVLSPGWVSPRFSRGSVPPGGDFGLDLQVNTAGLAAGEHLAELVLLTDDPLRPEVRVNLQVHVQEPALAEVTHDGVLYRLRTLPPRVERSELPLPGRALPTIFLEAPTSGLWVDDSGIYVGGDNGVVHYDLDGGGGTVEPGLDLSFFDPRLETAPLISAATLLRNGVGGIEVTLRNTGRSPLRWTAGGRRAGKAVDLDGILARLDGAGTSSVTAPVQDLFLFSDGETGTEIVDGGDDMYDTGNQLSTDLGDVIPYSDGVVASHEAFGAGGRYFTRKFPGLFVLVADLDGVSSFAVEGSLGADGRGLVDGAALPANPGWPGHSAFVKRVFDAGDPSVNHLVIVEGAPSADHSFPADTNRDDHEVTGLLGAGRIHLLVYAQRAGRYVDDPTTAAVMEAYLSVVSGGAAIAGVSPPGGEIPPGAEVVIGADLDVAGMAPGLYDLELDILSHGPEGGAPEGRAGTVEIALTVEGRGIELAPGRVRVAAVEGYPFAPVEVVVGVGGEGGPPEIDWAVAEAPPWLEVTPAESRAPTTATLTFDRVPGLGHFEGVVRFVASGSTYELPVSASRFALSLTHLVADRERPFLYGLHPGSGVVDDAFLVIFGAADGRVERAVPIGINPSDLTVHYPEGRLYVTNHGHDLVRVVDWETWEELEPLRLGHDAFRVNAGRRGRIYTEGREARMVSEIDTTTGEGLGSFGRDVIRAGDGEVDPTGRFYYHCSGGFLDDAVRKFDLDLDPPVEVATGPERRSGTRELLISADGSRIFWRGFFYDADLVEIGWGVLARATTRRGDLVFSTNGVFRVPTARWEADLPFATDVMAVSGDDRTLFLFQPESGELVGVPIADLVPLMGPAPLDGEHLEVPPDELSFPAAPAGAVAYEVFLGLDRDAVAAAESGSALHVGTVDTARISPAPLRAGRIYYWRVDGVAGDGTRVPGAVWTFSVAHQLAAAVPGPRRGPRERFGTSVAMDDDLVLVGAPCREPLEPGSAYTLRRVEGGVWIVGQRLTREGVHREDGFGAAVAVSGNTALVGAPGREDDVGEAHFFVRDAGGNWVENHLAVPEETVRSRFGQSLALLDDLALVGAPVGPGGAGSEGFVHDYRWDYGIGEWTLAARLDADPAWEAGGFGRSVALSPGWAAVGAPTTNVDGIPGAGLVFLFALDPASGEWRPAGQLVPAEPARDLLFGNSVALDGGWLAVGAPGDDDRLRDGGAVYLYRYEGEASGWVFVERLVPSERALGNPRFGFSVSLSGDFLAAGGTEDDRMGRGFGAIFSHQLSGGLWRPLPDFVVRPGTTESPGLGRSLAISGGTLIAGLPTALDAAGQEAGRVEFTTLGVGFPRPRFRSVPATRVDEGASYRYEVVAEIPGDEELELSAPALPGWLGLELGETGSGVLSGSPSVSDAGLHHVQLMATSGSGRFAIQTIRVQVGPGEVNEPPASTGLAALQHFPLEGRGTVDLRSVFQDPESAELAFDIRSEVGDPVLLAATVGEGTGELEFLFRPGMSGSVDLRVRATDGGGRSVQTVFRVTVPVGGAPVLESFAGDRDGDGDGASDLVEAAFGAAASDPASRPWVDLDRVPGGAVTLRWSSTPGYRYRAEGSESLLPGAWFPVGAATATGDVVSLGDSAGGAAATRFYRLVLADE